MPFMTPATRSSYHHGALRPALIGAARDMLANDGPGAVSLRESARRVGVSATATYRHFQDKEHLLAAVAAEGFVEFAERLEAGGAKDFAGMGIAYLEFAITHPGLFRLMFGPLLKEREKYPELAAAADASFAVLLDGAKRFAGDKNVDVEITAYTAWSCSHGLARLVIDDVIPAEQAFRISRAAPPPGRLALTP
jgi:AcrR family transcriptional regulator